MADWTKLLFNRAYVATEGLALSERLTRRECQVAIQVLGLDGFEYILDLACGHGRHSLELARLGFGRVVGLDYNQAAIEKAQQDASGTTATFVQGDMLHLTYQDNFDVVLSFFNSIFYWDDATHLQVFAGIHRALKPNGRLMLDSYNPFYSVHRKLLERHPIIGKILYIKRWLGQLRQEIRHRIKHPFVPRDWHETTSRFDPKTGLIQGSKNLVTNGVQEQFPLEIRLYTFTEVEKLLIQSGFLVEKVISNTGGVFLDQSPRFIVVARAIK